MRRARCRIVERQRRRKPWCDLGSCASSRKSPGGWPAKVDHRARPGRQPTSIAALSNQALSTFVAHSHCSAHEQNVWRCHRTGAAVTDRTANPYTISGTEHWRSRQWPPDVVAAVRSRQTAVAGLRQNHLAEPALSPAALVAGSSWAALLRVRHHAGIPSADLPTKYSCSQYAARLTSERRSAATDIGRGGYSRFTSSAGARAASAFQSIRGAGCRSRARIRAIGITKGRAASNPRASWPVRPHRKPGQRDCTRGLPATAIDIAGSMNSVDNLLERQFRAACFVVGGGCTVWIYHVAP